MQARAEATRRSDLQSLLTFAARRRLARLRRAAGGGAEPAVAGTTTPRWNKTADGAHSGPTLLERTDVTENLLRLSVARPRGFRYRPGQHVKMGLPGLTRKYSLASAPHQDHLEFFVELFPGGRLSERLRAVRPGTALAVGDKPRGALRVDTSRTNQLLIATVTGIAPYVSFVRDHLHRSGHGGRSSADDRPAARLAGARRFVILHGASFADELGYAGELAELARRHPALVTYVPTVSRPDSPRNAAWRGARGRVESHVEALVRRLVLTPANTAAFVCGNPAMVRSVSEGLRHRGFTTHTEPFD